MFVSWMALVVDLQNKFLWCTFLYLNFDCDFSSDRTQRNSAYMPWTSLQPRALVINSITSTHIDQTPHHEVFFTSVCFFQGAVFSEVNSNLSLWEAAVGSSYMCNKEQNYTITNLLTIYTFDLQVQPFGVKKGGFSTGRSLLTLLAGSWTKSVSYLEFGKCADDCLNEEEDFCCVWRNTRLILLVC